MTVIPGQFSELSDGDRRVTQEWWRFFNWLRDAVLSAGGSVSQIDEILARLDALENDSGLDALIHGVGSIVTLGTLANGVVQIRLQGDSESPGNTYYYGTGPDGVKGFLAIADALVAEAGELTKAVGSDGVATFGLADLADAGGGAIRKFDRDAKGRVSGTSAATTDDLAEGATNLYFTDERAQDAVGSILANTPTVNLTYDDGANTISADVNASAIDHNDTGGKQGGTAGEYYHVTAAEHTGLVPWSSIAPSSKADDSAVAHIAGTETITGAWTFTATPMIYRESDSATASAALFLDRARVGPAVVQSGDRLAAFYSRNYDGSGFFASAGQEFYATETHSGTAAGTRCVWATTANGTRSRTNRWGMSHDGHFIPESDNAYDVGSGSNRARVFYAGTGTINTSDEREKTPFRDMTAPEISCAIELASLPCVYKWLAAVEEKGDAARLHVGPGVQSVIAVMGRHGLDPFAYGFVCFDQWGEQPEQWDEWPEERDEDGNIVREAGRELVQPFRPAGDRYSLRPSELAWFVIRGQAARQDALEARIAALGG